MHIYMYWVQPAHCNSHHKQKRKKHPRNVEIVYIDNHISGRLEPESLHDMISFQGGRGLVKQRKILQKMYGRALKSFALGSGAK